MNELFYELIRVSIGTQSSLSRIPSDREWGRLFKMAAKQSLTGICFYGLQNLGADADVGFESIGMSEMRYLNWMSTAAQIQERNQLMDGFSRDSLAYFRERNIPCQVMKGQGMASLYGPLGHFRQSGDVDVWLNCKPDDLYGMSMEKFGCLKGVTYHHIHFPLSDDYELEAHIYPSFLHNIIKNRRLHTFFDLYKPQPGCGDYCSPAFNRVFILIHAYNHFSGHGVGMRQLMDYYFVLKQGFTEEEREDTLEWLNKLGLTRFAKAVMWLMKYVFGLPDDCLLLDGCEKDGRFLLNEIMQTGNMGRGDKRVNRKMNDSALGRFVRNLGRDFRIARICPDHVFWEPVWGVYKFFKIKSIKDRYRS